jgi:histone deacetylase 6
MDDEDTEGFMDFFDNCQSNIEEKKKCSYEPIHLPLSIIEILQTWNENGLSEELNSRIGICPCDYLSLDGMYIHVWSESHVEQPSRLTSIINYFHDQFWIKEGYRWKCLEGRMINNEEIKLVHTEKFLEEFLSVERGETVDTIPSMRTLSYANAEYDFKSVGPIVGGACRIAAGSTINLIKSIVKNEIDYGFAFIRPAGHHSSTVQIGTFCGLNSISIGAVYAIEILKLDRVLILDWDIHRSGGTEQIIGQLSNKYRLIDIYAAFGKISKSTNIPSNVHLIDMYDQNRIPGDNEYINIFDSKILPDIIQFNPSLILISAGFDGAQGESEECAQITPYGYFQMTRKLKQLHIPLAFILEGGYQLQSLFQSIGATFQALLDLEKNSFEDCKHLNSN